MTTNPLKSHAGQIPCGSRRASRQILDQIQRYECRNVTFIEGHDWPVVWSRASGVHVWDADGRKYLDLTAAFGVAACGHANRAVTRAAIHQMRLLPHAMGDVHPHPGKAALARALSALTFERWSGGRAVRGKSIFGNSGFEAVEAALKTACLATGKPGIIAWEGAYHGLGYGALTATHRLHFRRPFHRQLAEIVDFVPFPSDPDTLAQSIRQIQRIARARPIGALVLEPVQGRAGIRVPTPDALPTLRRLADKLGFLLIADEIFTGFGRTGAWFACERSSVVPDLICLGKALTGGFPLSACVGSAGLMDRAWPAATGEAIHTSTFLGNPVGCAMALAQIDEIRRRDLVSQSADSGSYARRLLESISLPDALEVEVRGVGLMLGLALRRRDTHAPATGHALTAVKRMLRRGFILLPEGDHGHVLCFTPPLVISRAHLKRAISALEQVLHEIVRD